MIFSAGFGQIIYDTLQKYFQFLQKVIVRFDHFLEMMIQNADFLQTFFPKEILDFNMHCKQDALPEGCSVVCFPRSPKPHEVDYLWIKKYWI